MRTSEVSPMPGAPTDAASRHPLGTHVKVGPGLVRGALARAEELGSEAMQVFLGNPRGWAHSPGRPEEDTAFREAASARGMRVLVHAPYLVNPGSPDPTTYERSVSLLAHNLRRAAAIGAEGVVVHTGSAVSGDIDEGLRRVREGLLPLLDGLADDDPWLLLEPTAGQGASLCAGVDGLEHYLDALDHHPRAGICLDTCHVFAAGAPLDEPGGTTATLDRVVAVGGPDRLRLVHLNDSADRRGSLTDRHAPLGTGQIGEPAFAELLTHPAVAGIPLILETPGSREPGSSCFRVMRRLRGS